MKREIIRETLKNKSLKKEFALITNLINGESEIFFPGHNLSGMFLNYSEEIEKIFNTKTDMQLFSWRGKIDTLLSPKDFSRFLITIFDICNFRGF